MEKTSLEKLQELNAKFCELKINKVGEERYNIIVDEIDNILEKEPDNVQALQLKILIKTSYTIIPWEEVDLLCRRLLKIDCRNKVAKRALKRITYDYTPRKPIEIDFQPIIVLIIAILCVILLHKYWIF